MLFIKCKEVKKSLFMYSDELMKYLYSYNMPQKSEEKADYGDNKMQDKSKDMLDTLKRFKNIYAAVPVEFRHE